MDIAKRNQLIKRLSEEAEPQIVPFDVFFDGNDDIGSIGCNLMQHPGIDAVREVLARVARRPDVAAVYVQISELDPGEGCWPFADTVLVVGTLSPQELSRELSSLEPDEVGPGEDFGVPEAVSQRHNAPVLVGWWD